MNRYYIKKKLKNRQFLRFNDNQYVSVGIEILEEIRSSYRRSKIKMVLENV